MGNETRPKNGETVMIDYEREVMVGPYKDEIRRYRCKRPAIYFTDGDIFKVPKSWTTWEWCDGIHTYAPECFRHQTLKFSEAYGYETISDDLDLTMFN